ncbi:hypothetical protein CAEBREN_19635 [Caenorhabditis brenneri]|uniref:Uncharacterized protein n=1 Tax=Caenorhabditis brenneri TaxID=135651 RepID=G0P1U8_CAEBE|nr:hypothetical protein CAEBREN_19635 [Caenorhabditis brenneri]
MGPKNGAISTDQEDICLQPMNKNGEADTNKTDQEVGNQIQLRVYRQRWIVWLTVFLRITYADITETPTKSASSSNGNCPTVIKSGFQKMESVLEEAHLTIEAISPAGKRDHVRAENRLRTCFASKKLIMPGSYVPKNRIIWKDAKDASNTSPSESKAPPRGFGTKEVPYRAKLTDDDKTKQSIERYWNYRIALFTKITSTL